MANKNTVGAVLAALALLGLLGITGVLLFRGIPEDNQQLVNISLMAIVGLNGTAFGFFLGASLSGGTKPAVPPGTTTTLEKVTESSSTSAAAVTAASALPEEKPSVG